MKKIFNLDKLVSITVNGKQEHYFYTYKKSIINWYGKKTNEGIYDFMNEYIGSGEYVVSKDNSLLYENKNIYYKPKVILRFVDGSNTEKYFDNFALANKWAHEIASKNITSKLEIKE